MNIVLITLGSCLVFFLCLIIVAILGYRVGVGTKPIKTTLEDKEAEKQRLMQEGWQNVLNYNEQVARGEKR